MNFLIPDKEPTDVADNNVGKMTDNDIAKALEYWKQFNKDIDTLQSTHPQYADMWDEQKEVVKITFEVFDSFNRQKAEIEGLKAKLKQGNDLICELCEKCGENACKDGEECDWKVEE